jgi:hypothetical protein
MITIELELEIWPASRSSFAAVRSTFALRAMVDNLRLHS